MSGILNQYEQELEQELEVFQQQLSRGGYTELYTDIELRAKLEAVRELEERILALITPIADKLAQDAKQHQELPIAYIIATELGVTQNILRLLLGTEYKHT